MRPVHQRAQERDALRFADRERLQADGQTLRPRRGHEPARRAADGQGGHDLRPDPGVLLSGPGAHALYDDAHDPAVSGRHGGRGQRAGRGCEKRRGYTFQSAGLPEPAQGGKHVLRHPGDDGARYAGDAAGNGQRVEPRAVRHAQRLCEERVHQRDRRRGGRDAGGRGQPRHGGRLPGGREPDAEPARCADGQFRGALAPAPRPDADGAGAL